MFDCAHWAQIARRSTNFLRRWGPGRIEHASHAFDGGAELGVDAARTDIGNTAARFDRRVGNDPSAVRPVQEVGFDGFLGRGQVVGVDSDHHLATGGSQGRNSSERLDYGPVDGAQFSSDDLGCESRCQSNDIGLDAREGHTVATFEFANCGAKRVGDRIETLRAAAMIGERRVDASLGGGPSSGVAVEVALVTQARRSLGRLSLVFATPDQCRKCRRLERLRSRRVLGCVRG